MKPTRTDRAEARRRMKRRDLIGWAAALIPALFVLVAYVFMHFVLPLPVAADNAYDPEMAYLLNSLAFFKSRPIVYYHHPGTPLTLMGTGVLLVLRQFWGLASGPFVQRILEDPQPFFHIAEGLLAAGSITTVVLLARSAWQGTKGPAALVSLAVGVSYFAVFPGNSFQLVKSWNHNHFALAAGTLLLLLIWRQIRRQPSMTGLQAAAWGLAAGMLWTVQYYFVAWLVGVTVLAGMERAVKERSVWRGLTGSAAAALGGLAGFGIGFLPILHRAREYVWWMRGLVFSGGGGGLPIPSPLEIWAGTRSLWQGNEILLVSLGLALVLVLLRFLPRWRNTPSPGWWAMASGVLVILAVAFLALVTSANVKGKSHVMPLAALVPILLLTGLDSIDLSGRYRRWAAMVLSIALIAGAALSLAGAVRAHLRARDAYEAARAEAEARRQEAVKRENNGSGQTPSLLWTYGTPSHCYALRFGNVFAERAFSAEINRICGREWAYDDWAQQITTNEGTRRFKGDEGWVLMIADPNHAPENLTSLGNVSMAEGLELVFVER